MLIDITDDIVLHGNGTLNKKYYKIAQEFVNELHHWLIPLIEKEYQSNSVNIYNKVNDIYMELMNTLDRNQESLEKMQKMFFIISDNLKPIYYLVCVLLQELTQLKQDF